MTVALAGALLVAGCGSGGDTDEADPTATAGAAPPAESVAAEPAAEPDVLAAPQRAVLTAAEPLVVRGEPVADAEVLTELTPTTALGTPRVLLADATADDWVRVSVPERPNGRYGWVEAAAVQLEPVEGELVVELAARQLRIVLDGELLAETTVGIGMAEHPTPTGRYYVTDRVEPPTPGGPYGAFALGLSAFSPTATDFAGGDGQVGIHGTNEPASIGQAASHGCIRVPDEVAAVLAQVPLGTPVTIR